MSDDQKCYQATPSADLRQQIMNPNVPKNEREWWASTEIELLEQRVARLEEFMRKWSDYDGHLTVDDAFDMQEQMRALLAEGQEVKS